jgi:hypothetical protein
MDRKAHLLEQIHEAFGDVQLRGGVTLHEATAIDDYASDEGRQAARQLDSAQRWQDVPDEHIARHYSVFSFLDVKGHVFYAPAYMCWLLRTGYDTPSNSVDAALFAFDSWGKHERGTHYKPEDMFSPAQCRVIAQYLLYVYEVLDEKSCCSLAKEPLDNYWSKYL